MKALPESAASTRRLRPRQAAAGGMGSALVVALLILALGLATFALWFQWNQTRRCLAFYGADAARSIQSAARVELWRLQTDASTGRVVALDRTDISAAPGLVHLRRGLVEDANFNWSSEAAPPRSVPEWDVAFAFFRSGEQVSPSAALAVDLDEPGIITVVGRPGRTELGRVGRGLRRWIEATLPEAGSPGEGRPPGL